MCSVGDTCAGVETLHLEANPLHCPWLVRWPMEDPPPPTKKKARAAEGKPASTESSEVELQPLVRAGGGGSLLSAPCSARELNQFSSSCCVQLQC